MNTPPDSTTVVDDLAALTATPPLFVLQFLYQLESQGHLKVVLTLGGFSRVTSISPALKRLLQ